MPKFSKTEFGRTHESEAYESAPGVWRWSSNDAVVPLDAAAAYGIPVDPDAQRDARAAEVAALVDAYRANPPQPSAEDLAEMRNVFGPNANVVNVITGKRVEL
jgi:hypothetical protein